MNEQTTIDGLPENAGEPTEPFVANEYAIADTPLPPQASSAQMGYLGCGTLAFLLALGAVGWMLGLGEVVKRSVAAGHLLDWVMGIFSLVWLLALLKVPWDLYFQALEVSFEQQRAKERRLPVIEGRAEYVRRLARRLGWGAVGAHLVSALIIAAITRYSGGTVGYYFAGFYLISTAFRPAIAGYVYLYRKLRAIGQETRYPREDIVEVRDRLRRQERTLRDVAERMTALEVMLHDEANGRHRDCAELRQDVQAISREFESAVSRITDNREVIQGIQAFVRLIARSAQSEGS